MIDKEVSYALQSALEHQGLMFRMNSKVISIHKGKCSTAVFIENMSDPGKKESVSRYT